MTGLLPDGRRSGRIASDCCSAWPRIRYVGGIASTGPEWKTATADPRPNPAMASGRICPLRRCCMPLKGKYALITGGSRGIGRGIALKLAHKGVKIAVHYYKNEEAAQDTLTKVREQGSDGFTMQADVTRPDDIGRMFDRVQNEFGSLDIFVSNARPDLPGFYQKPLDITLNHWQTAMDSQARAFLVGAQACSRLLRDSGRIIAITYSPSGRTGSWQPWVGMGAAKAALDALVRYFAVALARRGVTVNVISPGATDDSVVGRLPTEVFQAIKAWHERLDSDAPGGHPSRHW